MFNLQKQLISIISFVFYINIFFCQSIYLFTYNSVRSMNKLLKKENSPLKFDTSSANINCFIRGKSKQKVGEYASINCQYKSKKRSKNDKKKQLQFHDKAFLQSVVCKILNDVDCEGITELIDNMVFPVNNNTEIQTTKDIYIDQKEHEQINQIFRDFRPYSKNNFYQNNHIYQQNQIMHGMISSAGYEGLKKIQNHSAQKYDNNTTYQSSLNNTINGKQKQSNPENQSQNYPAIQGNVLPYAYNFYNQGNYYYHQRNINQRKRKNVSGEEALQFKIMLEKIQFDGRTTLMIRHIPNKYSEEMLLEQIGRNHKMKINFLYLPIDQFNSCNVGYAFVNFIHTKFIHDFYREFSGRRWDKFNSEKICQLAYARIQGTTNLMDHFQHATGGQLRGKLMNKPEQKIAKQQLELDQNSTKIIDSESDYPNL